MALESLPERFDPAIRDLPGPQDWTAYKEFAVVFEPDYEAGAIVLPEAFFAAVNDDSTVNLTFHFWSGATVQYTLERSGTTVTGSAA